MSDDDCPICGSYQPKRYGPCSVRCEWLYANLTKEQITEMHAYERKAREEQRETDAENERLREIRRLRQLKEKYPDAI